VKISENKHVGFCFLNTGILYATLGDYASSGQYFSKAQNVFEQIYDPEDISLGRFYMNFGRMVHLSGQIHQAIEYYDKAENIFKKESALIIFLLELSTSTKPISIIALQIMSGLLIIITGH
jgi:tetratricopeptide (TPR) repeat protein